MHTVLLFHNKCVFQIDYILVVIAPMFLSEEAGTLNFIHFSTSIYFTQTDTQKI